MLAPVFGFYSYAAALCRNGGYFQSNARRDAWEFGVSKNTVTAWTRFLLQHGWFILRDSSGGRFDPKTGQALPYYFLISDHDDWTALHPNECRFPPAYWDEPVRKKRTGPVPTIGTGKPSPKNWDRSAKLGQVQSQFTRKNPKNPVPTIGTKTVKKEKKDSNTQTDTPLQNAARANQKQKQNPLSGFSSVAPLDHANFFDPEPLENAPRDFVPEDFAYGSQPYCVAQGLQSSLAILAEHDAALAQHIPDANQRRVLESKRKDAFRAVTSQRKVLAEFARRLQRQGVR
jgi:hypothetical protein